MSERTALTRRSALLSGAGLGFTLLASRSGAEQAAFGDRKLVVLVLRGAMDGLSFMPPLADPDYPALRGEIAIAPNQALKLDGQFGLHPKLTKVHELAGMGQARFAPAAAIPQRIRSHFEAQDLLETGGAQLYAASTGWLNRALQVAQRRQAIRALSVGGETPLILRGPVQPDSWSPGGKLNANSGRVATTLQDLYAKDPLLGPALASGLKTEAMADALNGGAPLRGNDVKAFAATAAKFLVAPGGPSIAVLSLDGFDTHARQGAANGLLASRLQILDDVVDGLRQGLGPAWSKAVVVAATEFGRTARINGTGGTDHGTASTVLVAGGALKAGAILGDWPTLQQAKLFENRDLAPTLDVRSVFKTVLAEHMGLPRRDLDLAVFPNSEGAPYLAGLV